MAVTIVLLISLSALLQQSAGERPEFTSLSTDKKDQQEKVLDKHNALRRSVKPTARNMLKMEWSSAAAQNAKRWGQKCTFAHSDRKDRTISGRGCGENLYMSSHTASWSDVVQTWFNEEKDFKYGHGKTKPNAQIGHYTQVVWYRSYILGCAVVHCPRHTYRYYYICHYCPAGNIQGSINTPYKPGRPCGDCPNNCNDKLCTNPCKHDDKFSNCPDLVRSSGCNHPMTKENCKASCKCPNKIK